MLSPEVDRDQLMREWPAKAQRTVNEAADVTDTAAAARVKADDGAQARTGLDRTIPPSGAATMRTAAPQRQPAGGPHRHARKAGAMTALAALGDSSLWSRHRTDASLKTIQPRHDM